jgi:WD40 repeat protein
VVVTCLKFSPDGKRMASTGYDGRLRIWSARDWLEEGSIEIGASGVLQIAFGPKSECVAVAADYLIQVFSVQEGRSLARIEVPLKGVYGVAISPDGRNLANAAADGCVRVWEW